MRQTVGVVIPGMTLLLAPAGYAQAPYFAGKTIEIMLQKYRQSI